MGAPYIIPDVSENNGTVDYNAMAAAPQVVGVIVKATEGVTYRPRWFLDNWQRARAAGGIRYGVTWLRGAYHMLRCSSKGADQAKAFLGHVERAGGWGFGDMLPCVDVEGAEVRRCGAALVEDTLTAFGETVTGETGREVILYSPFAKETYGIKSKCGCSRLWTPNYGSEMAHGALGAGVWTLADVVLWQYCDGDGSPSPAGLPTRMPGVSGACDISVVIAGARKPWLWDVHHGLRMNRLDPAILAVLAGAAVVGAAT